MFESLVRHYFQDTPDGGVSVFLSNAKKKPGRLLQTLEQKQEIENRLKIAEGFFFVSTALAPLAFSFVRVLFMVPIYISIYIVYHFLLARTIKFVNKFPESAFPYDEKLGSKLFWASVPRWSIWLLLASGIPIILTALLIDLETDFSLSIIAIPSVSIIAVPMALVPIVVALFINKKRKQAINSFKRTDSKGPNA